MAFDELYNIHDILSFQLNNNIRSLQILPQINHEYKYFKSRNKNSNHFQITVNNSCSEIENPLKKNGKEWIIDLDNYNKNNILNIYPKKLGIKNFISFLIFKNIYTRSLLSLQLLDSNATLLHSCAFEINKESFIFAGRPGVFKTSILMDAIRYYKAKFIGEENCLIHNSKLYPFPLNIDSITYKIKNYKNENASGKIQKIKLGIYLLKKIKSNNLSLSIASPCTIQNIYYLTKGNGFSIKETDFNDILPYLIDNELQELSIPPTHSLSGIDYNFFKELLEKNDQQFFNKFTYKLKKIFTENFNSARFFLVTSPQEYTKSFTDSLISFIKR